MAKAKSGEKGSGDDYPRLTIPKDQFQTELTERLALGYDLLRPEGVSEHDLKRYRDQFTKWNDYNKSLLRKRFTTSEIADEYRGPARILTVGPKPLAQLWEEYQTNVERSLRRLESINERIALFDEGRDSPTASHTRRHAQHKATTIFIVHGHDNAHKQEVARLLERCTSLTVTILHEQPNQGHTIIEKFEDYPSDAGFAVVLLTADDVGFATRDRGDESKWEARPRQNVVFELGFFVGWLGRSQVCALYQEGVKLPSDMSGVAYTELDTGGAWKMELLRELDAAKIQVDATGLLK